MQKRILFGEKLHHQLVNVLEQAGFQLVEVVVEPFEVLKYERKRSSDLKPDIITFHGLEEGHLNSIYSDVATKFGGGFFLKTIKVLLPNYTSLPIQEIDKWVYRNDEELNTCLNEITELIKNSLLKWFDAPSNNPAGLDMSIKLNLNPQELGSKLREQIRIFELALERAKLEGRMNDIQRYERTINEFMDKLSSINPDIK